MYSFRITFTIRVIYIHIYTYILLAVGGGVYIHICTTIGHRNYLENSRSYIYASTYIYQSFLLSRYVYVHVYSAKC